MKTLISFLLCITFFCAAEEKSPASNVKEPGVLEDYKKELKEDGFHRKVAKRLIDELAHIFPGEFLKPRPNMNEHINRLVLDYQANYTTFEKNFFSSKKTTRRKRRKGAVSKPGEWQHLKMYPTSGRIYDLELNPKNPDEIYANPDNDGIFFTKDRGRTWESITDTIPSRLHREAHENIIVDPINFKHVFAISQLGNMHETKDGGKTWESIENKNDKNRRAPSFKWVEAFRNAKKELILIGTVAKGSGLNRSWRRGVYRSTDSGKNWTHIAVDGEGLQEMAFHKRKRNIVYLGSRSKLFISTDSGQSFSLLKDFKTGDRPMFVSTLGRKKADGLYVAISTGNDTQVHFSSDRGATWELRQDSASGKGYDKGIFGNDGSSAWTSYFEVDPFDENHLIASSVGSCESHDGGRTWVYQSWGRRADAVMADGSIAPAPHGGHNADNHVAKFHPREKGYYVKGCDAGIMMKTAAKHDNWTNINGDMPAFLWYSIIVNDFGDRYIAGNTQDVNIQTYRYGKWENEIGYEGDVIFMNPYTNISYYPLSSIEKGIGLGFFEPGRWKMTSWGYPVTASNYRKPDQYFIAFGRRPTEPERALPKYLYFTENRGKSYKRIPNLDQEVFSLNVSRTKEERLTIFTAKGLKSSTDLGQTWISQNYSSDLRVAGGKRRVSAAVNPDNPDQLWVSGAHGTVISSLDGGKTWKDISGKLPKGQVSELVFHEGTKGDLYALVNGFGVFYKAAEKKEWQLWMDGFNLKDFRQIRIDYQHQKLIAASYGRGAWEASLMKPSERFHQKGFKIKQLYNVDGFNAFTIDSQLVTPDYYTYKWYRNKKRVGGDNPTLLLKKCKSGDQINLVISPKRFRAVRTKSSSLKVKKRKKLAIKVDEKEGLSLDGRYVDLGSLEYFAARKSFSFETTVKLEKPGVIAANRRHFYRDAKGWYLALDKNGVLSLHLSARQNGALTRTFKKPREQAIVLKTNSGSLALNTWSQIAFTVEKSGEVKLYVNAREVAAGELAKSDSQYALNSVFSTTLLADPMGQRPCSGEVKNVRIWGKALKPSDLKSNNRTLSSRDALLYYVNFASKTPREAFTKKKIAIKSYYTNTY